MTTMGILIGVFWALGIAAAWYQLHWWFRNDELDKPRCYLLMGAISLLSWLVFPLYCISEAFNELND